MAIAPKKTVQRGTGTQRQELRRHKKLDTLMIYDDNRGRDRQDISQMLDGMFSVQIGWLPDRKTHLTR